jgi:HEAT repeat protein
MTHATREVDQRRESEIIDALRRDGTPLAQRRALVKELGRIGGDASIGVLRESLRSSDIELAARAVRALARIGTDEGVDALIECLDMATGTRFTLAAAALRKLRSRRAMPALIRCLETRGDKLHRGDRRILILALGEVPHVSEVPVLSAALRSPGYRTRNAAAWALAQIRAPESSAALEAAARELSWFGAVPIRRGLRLRRRRADDG